MYTFEYDGKQIKAYEYENQIEIYIEVDTNDLNKINHKYIISPWDFVDKVANDTKIKCNYFGSKQCEGNSTAIFIICVKNINDLAPEPCSGAISPHIADDKVEYLGRTVIDTFKKIV